MFYLRSKICRQLQSEHNIFALQGDKSYLKLTVLDSKCRKKLSVTIMFYL